MDTARMSTSKTSSQLSRSDYDLISSPMMINGIFQKLTSSASLPCISPDRTPSQSPSRDTPGISDSRGQSRTATSLLDPSLPAQTLQEYEEIRKMKQTASYRLGRKTLKPMETGVTEEQEDTMSCEKIGDSTRDSSITKVSVYSGPLYNDRMPTESESSSSNLADRLAHARMMQKSGYSWDQSGSSAKIRLGDGAILQNLYPSHSHVRHRNGKIERIDAYYLRMIANIELLSEITTIKNYEYNQWSRTRQITEKEYRDSFKALPFDKLESKSVQPSWDTLRPNNNSYTTLGSKNRLFGYEDLAAKFSHPKFLKRMGFIDSEADYNPITFTLGSEDEEIGDKQPQKENSRVEIAEPDKTNKTAAEDAVPKDDLEEEIAEDLADDNDSDELDLSSDDEEYHRDPEPIESLPPERVPSSCRSAKQRLALYNNDNVIGSKSSISRTVTSPDIPEPIQNHDIVASTEKRTKAKTDPELPSKSKAGLAPVKLVDDLSGPVKRLKSKLNDLQKDTNGPNYKASSFHSQSMRKDPFRLEIPPPSKFASTDKKFVRFSQPVCLCPKLSKETLNSFYSPTMQRYLANHGSTGFMKCRLHSPTRQAQIRDKIILKSL